MAKWLLRCTWIVSFVAWTGTTAAGTEVAHHAPMTLLESTPTRTLIEFDGGVLNVQTYAVSGVDYAEYTVPGFDLSVDAGAPHLPVFATLLETRPGATSLHSA
jgi:hypothetical protein